MLERLGDVFYWISLIFAIPLALTGAATAVMGPEDQNKWFLVIMFATSAAVAYGVGRAIRYVLAGR